MSGYTDQELTELVARLTERIRSLQASARHAMVQAGAIERDIGSLFLEMTVRLETLGSSVDELKWIAEARAGEAPTTRRAPAKKRSKTRSGASKKAG